MNICNNSTSKTYPDLNTTAPQGPQIYSLNETEIEAYSPEEIKVCKKLAKKVVFLVLRALATLCHDATPVNTFLYVLPSKTL